LVTGVTPRCCSIRRDGTSQASSGAPNITIVPLPPKCPELNPQENAWQFMRDNWLSNRVLASYDALLDHCCDVWNKLVDQPWLIMSIGLRDWADGFWSGSLGIKWQLHGRPALFLCSGAPRQPRA
jgi:hypothetical protein